MSMEIDISRLFNPGEFAPRDYSASVAEIGENAGRATWQAACNDSAEFMLLDTDEKREAMRDHVRGFGAWDADEIAAWSDLELNALFLQMVAGDMREADLDTDAPDWDAYEAGAEAGRYSSRIGRGCDEKSVWYYLGD